MPASLNGVGCSPNSTNAASSEISSDSRCAASLRTMPACRTEAPSARKIAGSSTPSPASASQGAPGLCRAASGGCSTSAVSTLATT